MIITPHPSIMLELARHRQQELHANAARERLLWLAAQANPSQPRFAALLRRLRRPQSQPQSTMLSSVSVG